MKPVVYLILWALLSLAPGNAVVSAFGQDMEGAKDHPMLNRMPGFLITEYLVNEFDEYEFYIGEDERKSVEGKKYELYYEIADGQQAPGEIQIVRNYVNALKLIGGEVLYQGKSFASVKVLKENRESWISIDAYNNGDNYTLTVVEKQAMRQDIVADADSMGQSIRNTGKVSLYGIFFDSGKSELKPESEPSLKEIARLLNNDPGLKLHVVGHTDNVGSFDFNKTLSDERARSVVRYLTSKYSISAERLNGSGVASLCPVASNTTAEGKALNRRVELVAQ